MEPARYNPPLATAMRHGVTPRRVSELNALLGVSRRTLERWRRWWQTIFASSPWWRTHAALLGVPLPEASMLPASLLTHFAGEDLATRVTAALRWIAPSATTGAAT